MKAEMSIQERLQKFPVPDSIWEEYHIDQEIFITGTNAGHADQSKLQQIESLNELATSCTIVYSDMPRNPNHGISKVERAVLKIIEVEDSLKCDVEDLVELKKEIMATIHAVADVELQTLLEKRYLCFLSWEKIAVEMHYSIQHIYRMHDEALSCVNAIMK